jgi:hypothetical protein
LQADLSLPQLGLAPGTYRQLIDEVTVVIHCAWKVDFNLTIESFESQIRGVAICLILVLFAEQGTPSLRVDHLDSSWSGKDTGFFSA